ncbi:serine/threonine-protein kinase [Trichococcus alkaliphilus]|uniref:serine/threonine-protein kinase n=1 Tax=Trichococcus alkaliphilus TaxID=2052943 RepID=UPI000D0BAFE2|nr:serine/threonine-protein kinase [Trichococcus alkaliphilus]
MKYQIKDTPYFVLTEEKPIYQGGIGKIYNCSVVDESGSIVQNNLVLKKIGNEEDFKQYHRFDREMRYLQKLNHKNILKPVYCDFDEYFIIMDRYPNNLEDYIKNQENSFDDCINIFSQILDGVGFYISEGYLHRDLKPQNILLDSESNVKITDFGISSRLFREGTINLTVLSGGAGTYYFCAPEQWKDLKNADERSEIFSLGRILYVLFTKDFSYYEMTKVGEISPQIRRIIKKATEFNPEKRYQTIGGFASDFDLLKEPTPSFNVKDYKLDKVIQLISENRISDINFEDELGFILNTTYEDKVDLMIKLDVNLHKNIWDNHTVFYTEFISNICDDIETRGYPFSYVDSIVSSTVLLLRGLNGILDIELQLRIIKSSARVAVYHNRFWAMGHVGNYISEIDDPFLKKLLQDDDGIHFKDDLEIISNYEDSDVLQEIIG